jgi:hypothetical protein
VHQFTARAERHLDQRVVEVLAVADRDVPLDHVRAGPFVEHDQVPGMGDDGLVHADRDVEQLDRSGVCRLIGMHVDQRTIGHQRRVQRSEYMALFGERVEIVAQHVAQRAEIATQGADLDAGSAVGLVAKSCRQVAVDEDQARGLTLRQQQVVDVRQLQRTEWLAGRRCEKRCSSRNLTGVYRQASCRRSGSGIDIACSAARARRSSIQPGVLCRPVEAASASQVTG